MRTLLLQMRNRTRAHLDQIRFYSRRVQAQPNMEIGKNQRDGGGQKFKATALTLFHRFCMIVGRLIFKFVYGEKGQAMPPINNLLLTEPATSLAAKIRTQKVREMGAIFQAIA